MRRRMVAVGIALACAATATAAADPVVAGATGLSFAPASTQSADWAGWDVTGGEYTSVSAKWTQPTVTCSQSLESSSAFWVGLDGDTSTSVEQTGTQANCVDGVAHYSAWYEFYPAPSVDLTDVVKAGDAMAASATYNRTNGTYSLTVKDLTRGWTSTKRGTVAAGANASAEVIAEAPTDSQTGSVVALADFGTAHFTDARVDGRPIGTVATAKRITMAAASESYGAAESAQTLATTSALTDGDRFFVTWKSAGATEASTGGSSSGEGQGGGSWPTAPDGSGGGSWGGTGDGGYGWGSGSGGYGYPGGGGY